MKRAPYSPTEGVFSRGAGTQTLWVGVMIGALALGLGSWYFFTDRPEWQTMIFTSLAFMQIFQALASRSDKDSLFRMGVLSNPVLAGMAFIVFALQMMVLYIPAMANFFEVVPLSLCDLSIAALTGVIVFAVMEVGKKLRK
jgi:Ca2+-transporting ATPase